VHIVVAFPVKMHLVLLHGLPMCQSQPITVNLVLVTLVSSSVQQVCNVELVDAFPNFVF